MKTFLKTVTNSVKHWYLFLIIGLIFTLFGIWIFATPLESYITLAVLFSLSFLVSGFFEILFAIFNRKEVDNWGWMLVSGLVSFILGWIMIANPQISMVTLPYYVGFVVLFRSFMAISTAIDLQHYGETNSGGLLVFGILGLIFSFIMLWNPVFAGMTIVFWTAAAFISIGIFNIYLSIRLRRIHKAHGEISDELKERYHRIKNEIHEEMKKRKDS